MPIRPPSWAGAASNPANAFSALQRPQAAPPGRQMPQGMGTGPVDRQTAYSMLGQRPPQQGQPGAGAQWNGTHNPNMGGKGAPTGWGPQQGYSQMPQGGWRPQQGQMQNQAAAGRCPTCGK